MGRGIVTNEYLSPCALLLGGFDGLHIGHKTLLDIAKTYNLPVGITTIYGGKGKSLFLPRERAQIFKAQGLDFVYPLHFTDEFKNTEPEEFLQDIVNRFNVKAFVCGDDFRFGKGAEGTPELIAKITSIPVHAPAVLRVNGEKVGASFIKNYLKIGDVKRANEYLLQPFFVTGIVTKDRGVGKTIGFPTANIEYSEEKFPVKEGVYAVSAEIDGVEYRGILNYGARPTFQNTEKKLEAYFDGFDGDLYGRELTVYFDEYIRDICSFASGEALKTQLQRDLRKIRE